MTEKLLCVQRLSTMPRVEFENITVRNYHDKSLIFSPHAILFIFSTRVDLVLDNTLEQGPYIFNHSYFIKIPIRHLIRYNFVSLIVVQKRLHI